MKKALLALSLSCLLAACGGSSDDDSSSGNTSTPPASSQLTGVLTDSPVENVRYETTSGITGNTNSLGEFKYKAGDSVTFYVGDIKLGSSAAQAYVTPIDLSADETARTNLLILLQSLDADQNHSNGITISDAVVTALKDKTIDLSLPTESFIQDATLLQVLQNAGLTLVSESTAKSNFFDSFIQDNTGVWVLEVPSENSKVVLYIDGTTDVSDGRKVFNFVLGETAAADDSGRAGIEKGQMSWDPVSGEFSHTQNFEIDTNGEWGLSHPQGSFTLAYGAEKDTLVVKEGNETNTFKRVKNTAGSLAGSWKTDNQLVTFFSDGSYIFVEVTGNECSSPGIESGTYTASNGVLKATSMQYDTNGCSGLVDSSYSPPDLDNFSYSINGSIFTIQHEGEDPVSFTRF